MKALSPGVIGVTLVLLLLIPFTGYSATFTSSTNGNWSASSTWGGAGVPGNTDDVIIKHGTTVTVNGTYTCHNLSIGDATTGVTTVNIGSGNSLTINGACSINPSNLSNTYTLNAGSGSVNIAGTLTWASSGTNLIEAGTGTVTFTPAVTSANNFS